MDFQKKSIDRNSPVQLVNSITSTQPPSFPLKFQKTLANFFTEYIGYH
uniref:Uncharacterized protein n=1 Tax=Anguilla anguilla TaxID=7936 RepID=A0A0E9XII7_ANGAN